ncbi:MAG: GNAT family N-acetyltransferase [Actinomycetota bacterium]
MPLVDLDEFEDADLEGLLNVRLSNPERLMRTEGRDGVPGAYDLQMLERDIGIALMDPERHVFVVRQHDTKEIIGIVDCLDHHPTDNKPWLGSVEIHAKHQGKGFARASVDLVCERVRDKLRATTIRAASDSDDLENIRFLEAMKFARIEEAQRGQGRVTIFERQI